MTITINVNKNTGSKVKVTCRACKISTNHQILTDVDLDGCEKMGQHDTYDWHNEYQIIQCQGCETVSFRKTHTNSEDYDFDTTENWSVQSVTVDVYPNPESGRVPIDDSRLLPFNLNRIYVETLRSLNSSQPVLTGIGVRAIVETICKDKNSGGNNLYEKINDLVTQGVLTSDGADILHKLRTLGNQAAHEVNPHDSVQLGLSFDVIEHLLKGVYILPIHAQSTFN